MYNHAKSQVSSSKNGWVMAVSTKEDTSYQHLYYYTIIMKIQSNSVEAGGVGQKEPALILKCAPT